MERALVVMVSLLLAACGRAPGPPPAAGGDGTVVAVVDGDTLTVDVGGRVEPVRLIGIDTPESVDPERPVECYGPEAAALLAELAPPGTAVRLERDTEGRDRFGRLLAYVFRAADGVLVNEAVAAAGAADVLDIPPNTAYRGRIGDAVAASRRTGAGMWGACGHPP